MDGERHDRRWLAMRGCDRILSGTRPQSMAERLEILATAGVDLNGPPDMGGDGPLAALEERVAGLLGRPAAVFFPSGTMAQQVALRCWARRSRDWTVAMHPLSHLEVHERRAYSALTGLHAVWPTRELRQPRANDIRRLDEPFGTLLLELPLRDAGFLLPTWDELVAVVSAARERGSYVHFDGARLWESTAFLGQELPAIAALADSVYVSLYKTLGGTSGAVLAGPADVMAEARAWRHRYGGQLSQQWPAVLSAWSGLDSQLPHLGAYVAHAATVAGALQQLSGARVFPDPPHTHQFQLWLPHEAKHLNEAALILAEQQRTWFCGRWVDVAPTGLSYTEVTAAGPALAWSAQEVVAAGEAFLACVRHHGSSG
jgi:threonine aldolase